MFVNIILNLLSINSDSSATPNLLALSLANTELNSNDIFDSFFNFLYNLVVSIKAIIQVLKMCGVRSPSYTANTMKAHT